MLFEATGKSHLYYAWRETIAVMKGVWPALILAIFLLGLGGNAQRSKFLPNFTFKDVNQDMLFVYHSTQPTYIAESRFFSQKLSLANLI